MHHNTPDETVTKQQPRGWIVPPAANVPGAILSIGMASAWLVSWFRGETMASWATSSAAIAEGRYETLLLYMFAHAGLLHITMNLAVLYGISGLIVARLGSWWRYIVLYLLCGFAGAALYLLLTPGSSIPMLGASGAISGLLGLLFRLDQQTANLIPLRSEQVFHALKGFAKDNLVLILMFTVPAILSGSGGGIAWEAHLGGLLFGLLAGPYLLPEENPAKPIVQSDDEVTATM